MISWLLCIDEKHSCSLLSSSPDVFDKLLQEKHFISDHWTLDVSYVTPTSISSVSVFSTSPQSHQITLKLNKYQINNLATPSRLLTNLVGDFVTIFFYFLGNNLFEDPAVHPASQFWFYKVCFEILIELKIFHFFF